ncbi:MAG: galactokinase, partial [Anaerolineae bacterium]|nr:galactokinase [Anaerolineae bacterium]
AFGPGRAPGAFRAPGRVNLIGEHTDYNEGFVLPMAVERYVWVVARPGPAGYLRLRSVDFGQEAQFDLGNLRPDPERPWANYVAGVAWAFADEGLPVPSLEMAVAGNVPIGAGLSSSAALETAAAAALEACGGLDLSPVRRALLCQRAEAQFVGVQCGIMDQFVSGLAREGHALWLDCRSLAHEHVPVPSEAVAVIADTGVRRELTASAYNERRQQCEEGVRRLRRRLPGIRALRDVPWEALERWREDLPEVVYRRCAHVVRENARVLAAVEALRGGDLEAMGRLMDASHASLRDLYEVSCPELDLMVELARGLPGCFGARLTGAGFGGCTVSLVAAERAEAFARDLAAAYTARTGRAAAAFAARPAGGAVEVRLGQVL